MLVSQGAQTLPDDKQSQIHDGLKQHWVFYLTTHPTWQRRGRILLNPVTREAGEWKEVLSQRLVTQHRDRGKEAWQIPEWFLKFLSRSNMWHFCSHFIKQNQVHNHIQLHFKKFLSASLSTVPDSVQSHHHRSRCWMNEWMIEWMNEWIESLVRMLVAQETQTQSGLRHEETDYFQSGQLQRWVILRLGEVIKGLDPFNSVFCHPPSVPWSGRPAISSPILHGHKVVTAVPLSYTMTKASRRRRNQLLCGILSKRKKSFARATPAHFPYCLCGQNCVTSSCLNRSLASGIRLCNWLSSVRSISRLGVGSLSSEVHACEEEGGPLNTTEVLLTRKKEGVDIG